MIIKWRYVIALVVAAFTIAAVTYAGDLTGPWYEYKTQVHSHMENAYWSADPYTMRNETQLAVAGMHALKLEPDMYGVFFSWDKTPDRQMAWQYKHMASVISRQGEFINWLEAQNDTTTQQFQDVYTAKLNNVREYIKNDGGWSDDIAQNTYYINYHVWYGFYSGIVVVLVLLVALVVAIVAIAQQWWASIKEEEEKARKKGIHL
jgi:hypothetical protein